MFIIKLLIISIFLYLLYLLILYTFQRKLIFPVIYIPAPEFPVTENIKNLTQVWLTIPEGNVEAWYLKAYTEDKTKKFPALIFAHGNGELIDYCVNELLEYTKLGISVLLIEYPGYGRSGGYPSEKTILNTFIKGYDWLYKNNDIEKEKIFAYGRSVGGGVVCSLSGKRKIRALILQSTFTDTKFFARRYLAPGFLVKDAFDNLTAVKKFNGPILIFHGKYDNLIPYAHGVALSRIAGNAVLVTYECSHNDCPPDERDFRKKIEQFLIDNKILDLSLSQGL